MKARPSKIDTRSAFCDKCHAAIRQYDTDGGLWLTDCEGGSYDCGGTGGLHAAPAVIGATVELERMPEGWRCAVCGSSGLSHHMLTGDVIVTEYHFVGCSAAIVDFPDFGDPA